MSENSDSVSRFGQIMLNKNEENINIQLISIIGEIEGHDSIQGNTKSTKYEHILPQLVEAADNKSVHGILFIINTVGGDVSSGLAIAEMIASIDKPTVALVIGDSHSIGVPLAVAADYSYIVPTGTVIIHPVRLNGTVIGAPQTYDYFKLIEDTIKEGKNVIIVAHGNSLRGLVKYLDNLSNEEVIKLEIDTGRPICYELDDNLKPIKHYYIDETK